MSSQWGKSLIPIALREFEEALQISVPLSRLSEFHDEAMITEVGIMERRKILEDFMRKISDLSGLEISELIKELDLEVKKRTEEYITKNAEHRQQSELLLDEVVGFLSREFESCLNTQLSMDPRMELDALRTLCNDEKQVVLDHFLNHWKPGNAEFHSEYQTKLDEKIDELTAQIEEKQRDFLEGPAERAKKAFEEAKQNLQEKCDQFNNDMETEEFHFKTEVSKALFLKKVEKARSLINKPDLTLEEIQKETDILVKASSKYSKSK